jgi:hypothetical protein
MLAGLPLTDYRTIVNLIAGATTNAGLDVWLNDSY